VIVNTFTAGLELINYSLGVILITIQQCMAKFLVALAHKLIVSLQHLVCISLFLNHEYLVFGNFFERFSYKITPKSIET